jgi:hypothetical protein
MISRSSGPELSFNTRKIAARVSGAETGCAKKRTEFAELDALMVVESIPKDGDIVAQQQPLTDGQSAITMSTHSNRHAVEFFDESTSEKYQPPCGF